MNRTMVFIHGAWMTPLCWEKFTDFYQSKGIRCIAPPWPYKDRPIAEQRANPDPGLAQLGVSEIVAHYEKEIRALSEPPILIGHSFGGLFVQMLLDRGLGAAGVAIDPAPPKGILPVYPTAFKALAPVLTTFGGWRKILRNSLPAFSYAFIHTLPAAEQKAIYDRYVVPETGRIFFQAATAPFHNTTYVNYKNNKRAPLLLIAGKEDKICPAPQIRVNYQKYAGSSAVTDFKEFPGLTHWIIAQDGWQDVAEYILDWVGKLN